MSKTINRVELLGRVGTEPEMRYAPSGTAVTQLRLATDRRRQDGAVDADWHTVTCWGKLAEAVDQYVHRAIGSTSPDGSRRTATRPKTASAATPRRSHAAEVVFLDSRNGANGKDAVDAAVPIEHEAVDSPF